MQEIKKPDIPGKMVDRTFITVDGVKFARVFRDISIVDERVWEVQFAYDGRNWDRGDYHTFSEQEKALRYARDSVPHIAENFFHYIKPSQEHDASRPISYRVTACGLTEQQAREIVAALKTLPQFEKFGAQFFDVHEYRARHKDVTRKFTEETK